jgi:hypothetical protein
VLDHSTIRQFTDADMHQQERVGGVIYEVPTISLVDLLDKYGYPSFVIDLLLSSKITNNS